MLLSLLCLHRAAEQGSDSGMSSWITGIIDGTMKYKDLQELFDVRKLNGILDKSVWDAMSTFGAELDVTPFNGYTGLRLASKFGDLAVVKNMNMDEFSEPIKAVVKRENMEMWYNLSEALGYDRGTFQWVYDRLTNKDVLMATSFADVFGKLALNMNPATDHAWMVFDSLASGNGGKVTLRQILSTLGASQEAINNLDALLKTFESLDNKIDIEVILRGASGLVRSGSESLSTALKEAMALLTSCFDAVFAHPMNFVDYPLSQRLQKLVDVWNFAKNNEAFKNDKFFTDTQEVLNSVAGIFDVILKNGFDVNELNKTMGGELSDETFAMVVSFAQAATSGSIVDILSLAGMSVGDGSYDSDDLLKKISTGEATLDEVFGVLKVLDIDVTATLQGFVNQLVDTPVLDLISSFGFNLTDPFLNGQELAQKIVETVKDTKLSTLVEIPEEVRKILQTFAKIAGTTISDVLNELLGVQWIDETFILTGDVLDATMILPRLANDFTVLFKPIIQRLFFDYIDRYIAVLRKGGFSLVDLTSIVVPTWSDIISKSLGFIRVFADKEATVAELWALFPQAVLDVAQTFKKFAALDPSFTVPELIYIITPNDKPKLRAEQSVFDTIQGGATVEALNLLNGSTGSVTIKRLEQTGLKVDTLKTTATDKFANKEPVSIDEIDSAFKEMTDSYQQEDPKGPNVGLIVGLTIMCLVIVGVAVGLAVYFLVIRKRKQSSSSSGSTIKTKEDTSA